MESRSALGPYRSTVVVSVSTLVSALLLSIVLWQLGLDGYPLLRDLGGASLPLSVAAGIGLVLAIAVITIHVSLAPSTASVTAEEPLVSAPRVPAVRRRAPFIVVVGVTPKAGATTLAGALAMVIATDGGVGKEARRPRPICLMRDDDLPSGVTLDTQSIDAYLRSHPADVPEDILDLAGRHPDGIEFLSIGGARPNAIQVDLLLPILREHYDAIIMDIPADAHWTASMSMGLADAVFLVVTSGESASTLELWLDRLWGLGLEGKTIVTIGRRRARDRQRGGKAYQFFLEIPEGSAISANDVDSMTWAVGDTGVTRQLKQAARRLLPDLYSKEPRDGGH